MELNCWIGKQVDSPIYEYFMPKFSENLLTMDVGDNRIIY
jgi:hypothetical protein